MKTYLLIMLTIFSNLAFAHRPLSQTTVLAMNMMRSPNVINCLAQLDSRHAGDFYIQRGTFHSQGTDSMYHLFGAFLEGGDMVHGSAHVDVKVGLLPPMGPGFECKVIDERD